MTSLRLPFIFLLLAALLFIPDEKSPASTPEKSWPGSFAAFLSIRWPDQFPRKQLQKVVSEYGMQASQVSAIESVFEAQGRSGVTEFSISKGLFVTFEEDSSEARGLYGLERRSEYVVTATPIWAPEKPKAGFFTIEPVDGRLSLLKSSFGDNFVLLDDVNSAKIRKAITEQEHWPFGLRLASKYAAFGVADKRTMAECVSIRKTGPAKAFDPMMSSALKALEVEHRASQGAQHAARTFIRGATSTESFEECPFLLLRLLAQGADIVMPSAGQTAITSVRVAFLGSIATECLNADGKLVVEALPLCTWDYLDKTTTAEMKDFIAQIGSKPEHWELALELMTKFASYLEGTNRRRYCRNLYEVGFQPLVCLETLGFGKDDYAEGQLFDVQVLELRDDKFVSETKQYRFTITVKQPLPVVTAAVQLRNKPWNNCSVPVFVQGKWWRVCPVEKADG